MTGLLAGGAAVGLAGTASATPAPASVISSTQHDHHSKCEWHKGHWEKKWVKAHWEKKLVHHKTWHSGHYDKHGTWHTGYWKDSSSYKWIYVPAHFEHHWVNGYWDCRHQ
jgi:hypothetical protein